MHTLLDNLATELPDIPRWVETRSLLLSGLGEVFGSSPAYAVRDPMDGPVFVVGRPDPELIREAIAISGGTEDIIAPIAEREWLAGVLPGWYSERAILHELRDQNVLPAFVDEGCGPVDPWLMNLGDDEDDLLGELRAAAAYSPVVASHAGELPVSFCYAGSITQGLWDVSIDTLPAYRRQGHASRCASYMIHMMHALQKRPVWASMEHNPASLRLADRLGFTPVDELIVFRRHRQPAH